MPVRLAQFACGFIIALAANLAAAQTSSLEASVDEVMQPWLKQGSPGAAVAYIERGQVAFSKAYGLANLEHRIPWSTRTVSDLAPCLNSSPASLLPCCQSAGC